MPETNKNFGSNDSQIRKNFEKNYMTFIIQGNSSKNSNNRVLYFYQILRDINNTWMTFILILNYKSLETNQINDLVLHLVTMAQSSRSLNDDEETNGKQLGSFFHLQMLLVYGMRSSRACAQTLLKPYPSEIEKITTHFFKID
ncbi:hypothetical protein BpHYR1_009341 [Brachionus plicatilis]|uniref:Uncharacterized protein n=1 Tax=Brachionus plicatilis TaxID=10195 RepID=A0A3M7QP58_BRAPC|nr:hypothetical protein BpHYR1_009341 [Brachionus plicatilis]